MTKSRLISIGIILGVAAVAFVSVDWRPVWASRNGGGTYTLPSGNPVVTGATISSAWANNTLNDLATAMTNSLDRTGATGSMTGQLKLANGTSGAPAWAFTQQTDTGIYRAGSSDIRFMVGGAEPERWSNHGVLLSLGEEVDGESGETALVVQGGTSGAAISAMGGSGGSGINAQGGTGGTYGVFSTGGTVDGVGVAGHGVGGGNGASFYGGTSTDGGFSGAGAYVQGGTGGTGLTALGGTSGAAISATGGAGASGINVQGGSSSGYGVFSTAGGPNGTSIVGYGQGTGSGGAFYGGATSGLGLYGEGGATNGIGGSFQGAGSGSGMTSTGGASAGVGGTFQGGASGAGISATGGAGASGINAAGGTGTTYGVYGVGGNSDGIGVHGLGVGAGNGGEFFGGATGGYGVYGEGGATDGYGGVFLGKGAGSAVVATALGSAPAVQAASSTGWAIEVGSGYEHHGASNPASDAGFTNTMTPANVPKAWVRATGTTVYDGFNVTSSGCSAAIMTVTLASAMANSTYAVMCTSDGGGGGQNRIVSTSIQSTTQFRIYSFNGATGAQIDLCSAGDVIDCVVFGRQ